MIEPKKNINVNAPAVAFADLFIQEIWLRHEGQVTEDIVREWIRVTFIQGANYQEPDVIF